MDMTKKSEIEKEAMRLEYSYDRGVNFLDRVIVLDGDLEDDCDFSLVEFALSEMERSSKKNITIRLKSYGGSVTEALAIVGRMKRSKCQITVEGYGAVMSAAVMILASADKRLMSEYGTIMHHQSSYGAMGSHTEIQNLVAQMEKDERTWSKWMAKFSNKNEEFWYKRGKRDFYMYADEALELGLIDEII